MHAKVSILAMAAVVAVAIGITVPSDADGELVEWCKTREPMVPAEFPESARDEIAAHNASVTKSCDEYLALFEVHQ